jgi:hypothetical protein
MSHSLFARRPWVRRVLGLLLLLCLLLGHTINSSFVRGQPSCPKYCTGGRCAIYTNGNVYVWGTFTNGKWSYQACSNSRWRQNRVPGRTIHGPIRPRRACWRCCQPANIPPFGPPTARPGRRQHVRASPDRRRYVPLRTANVSVVPHNAESPVSSTPQASPTCYELSNGTGRTFT